MIGLPELLLILAGAALTVAACWSLGRFLSWRLELSLAAQFGLGAALLSLPVFALLAAGVARNRTLFALLAVALLPALVTLRPPRFSRPRFHPVAAAVAAVYGFLYVIHALAPEIQPDAAGYHLGLVREWLRLNGFSGRAGFYEALPHGLEMLFVPAYALGAHSAAKLVHLAFLAATVPLAADAARRLGLAPLIGTFAGLLYATLPVAGVTGASAYNDAALVFFLLLTFDLLLVAEDTGAKPLAAAAAGIAAGFCYAIKMSGGLAAAGGLVWLLYRRRWRAAGWFALSSAFIAGPWVVRNTLQFGNPVAPFFNGLFPNPHFHPATEAALFEMLRDYGGVGLALAIPALAFDGRALQGLIGPVLLLLPLGLLALRRPRVRLLPLAGLVLMLPWFLNLGARFLMPALLFFALALMATLPRRAAAAIVVLGAVLGLPPVAGWYSDPDAWRLRGLPLRAALRIEPESEYLNRTLWTTELASLVGRHTAPGEAVLDLFGAPAAYTDAVLVRPWTSASADRMRAALELAADRAGGVLASYEARWQPAEVTALRFLLDEPQGPDWSIFEVRLEGIPEEALRAARLAARPNVWEAPLALDGNWTTKWAPWQRPRAGDYLEIRFRQPASVSGASLLGLRRENQTQIRFLGRQRHGGWLLLGARPHVIPYPALDLRRSAAAVLKREGVSWILAPVSGAPLAAIGRDLLENPAEWGVTDAGSVRGVHLFRIRLDGSPAHP